MTSAKTEFINGTPQDYPAWPDTEGNHINAHDGGIIYAASAYHWYGMHLRPCPALSGEAGGQKTTVGVVMYRSEDLCNWTYEGVILPCSDDPVHPLYGPMRLERPKIVYNEHTGAFVMWFHYVGRPGDHGDAIGEGEAGTASCDTVNGTYTYHGCVRPVDDHGSVKDCTLYKDDDGAAYFIYDRKIVDTKQRNLFVVKLTDDYLRPTDTWYDLENTHHREAPAIVKHGGYYYMVTSGTTGWRPNQAKYYRGRSVTGPYEDMGDPHSGEFAHISHHSQATHIFRVENKQDTYIYMAERHNTDNMINCSYIWLPVEFTEENRMHIPYLERWRLD